MSLYKEGDKFIIEIEKELEEGLYKMKDFNALVFDEYGLDNLSQLVKGVDTDSYHMGLLDAWDLALKVHEMDWDARNEAFGRFPTLRKFFETVTPEDAMEQYTEWAKKKEEGYVDWSKVPVDTKILTSTNGEEWHPRHFAKFEDGEVYAFNNGMTSFSTECDKVSAWAYAKLAEE